MALIESGLLTQLSEDLDYEVHHDNIVHYYEKDIPTEDPDHRGMKKPRAVSAVTEKLSSQVYDYAKDGKFILTLGGDHSIAIGTVSGTAKAIRERLGREMAVIWVDAHADINLPETSGSGNIHGMPMAFLTRLATEEKKDIFGWMRDEHIVSTQKIVYIGLRDVDRGEKKILRENGIKAFSMHDIDRYVHVYLFLVVITLLTSAVMVLVVLLKWRSLISVMTRPFTCLSMSMRSILSGLLAPVLRSVVG
jgi:arginase